MKTYTRLLAFGVIAMLAAVGLLLLASPVEAQHSGTVRYCGNVAEGTFPFADGTKVTLSQWDKNALGIPNATLTKVTVTATQWITQSFLVTSTQGTPGTFFGYTDARMRIFSPNKLCCSPGNNLFNVYGHRDLDEVTINPGATYDYGTGYYTSSGSKDDTPVTPYIGTGTVDFPVTGAANFLNEGTLGNYIAQLTTIARAEICVIYSFSNPTAVTLSSFSQAEANIDWAMWGVAGMLALGVLCVAGWRVFR